MKKVTTTWILIKPVITILLLVYSLLNFYSSRSGDEVNELVVIELSFYTMTSFLLIYFYYRMYQTMKFVVLFDFVFLVFIAYQFHINYIMLFLDLVTIFILILDNSDFQNYARRKLRKINIEL